MADLNVQLTRGNDLTLQLHFKDPEDNNQPIDMSDAIGMVLVFIDSNNKQFAKFSQEGITGYEDIDVSDAVNGNIVVELQAEQTLLAKCGQVKFMFKVTYDQVANSNADADYGFNRMQILGTMNDSPLAKVVTH